MDNFCFIYTKYDKHLKVLKINTHIKINNFIHDYNNNKLVT